MPKIMEQYAVAMIDNMFEQKLVYKRPRTEKDEQKLNNIKNYLLVHTHN